MKKIILTLVILSTFFGASGISAQNLKIQQSNFLLLNNLQNLKVQNLNQAQLDRLKIILENFLNILLKQKVEIKNTNKDRFKIRCCQTKKNKSKKDIKENRQKVYQFGINLDVARRFYTPDEIKKYIDLVSTYDKSFLQLHLSDDQNAALESEFLNQTVANATVDQNGIYTNPNTQKQFLSKDQIRELINYAKTKNIELIPEIDMPAHAKGFLDLAKIKFGQAFVDNISDGYFQGELNISKQEALDFSKSIYTEYAELFKDLKYFHMGADEVFSANKADKLSYIQNTSNFLKSKGFKVRMWNDLILKENLSEISKDIQVTYWSFDGDAQDPNDIEERRKNRASVPDLQKNGFEVLIYNSYYLFFVPSSSNFNQHDIEYMQNDLKDNWSLKKWDSNNDVELENLKGIIGAAHSIWNENSDSILKNDIYEVSEGVFGILKNKGE